MNAENQFCRDFWYVLWVCWVSSVKSRFKEKIRFTQEMIAYKIEFENQKFRFKKVFDLRNKTVLTEQHLLLSLLSGIRLSFNNNTNWLMFYGF